jgi:hypothetical protein
MILIEGRLADGSNQMLAMPEESCLSDRAIATQRRSCGRRDARLMRGLLWVVKVMVPSTSH